MSLAEQQQVIEEMRSSLHPPAGVSAQLVGLPVLAAQSGAQVASPWRRLETLLIGLAAVALVLLIAFRGDRRRALVPLVPIALATGWSALILFAVRVPLNPMSVTLGRAGDRDLHRVQRAAVRALPPGAAGEVRTRSRRCGAHTARTGAAVAASGVTAIAGFGVLVLSDIRMLRDFGLVNADRSERLAAGRAGGAARRRWCSPSGRERGFCACVPAGIDRLRRQGPGAP